jgi:hypothetical protein
VLGIPGHLGEEGREVRLDRPDEHGVLGLAALVGARRRSAGAWPVRRARAMPGRALIGWLRSAL